MAALDGDIIIAGKIRLAFAKIHKHIGEEEYEEVNDALLSLRCEVNYSRVFMNSGIKIKLNDAIELISDVMDSENADEIDEKVLQILYIDVIHDIVSYIKKLTDYMSRLKGA